MRAMACLAAALCGCYPAVSLTPGVSTEGEVLAAMGAPALRGKGAGGETLLWYPSFPYGRQSYAALISPDGRLVSIENRLTDPYLAKLKVNETRREEVLEMVGPPYRASHFPRMQREIWDYPMPCRPSCFVLLAQFSQDGVLRELYQVLDPDMLSRGRSGW
jgi:hypothetical protein